MSRQSFQGKFQRWLPDHALAGGVHQQRRIGQRVVALLPCNRPDRGAEFPRQFLGARRRAIEQADLARAAVGKAGDDGPRRPAGTQHCRRSGVSAPVRLGVEKALDVTKAVVVKTAERAVRPDDDGVDGADATRDRVDMVKHLHRGDLVRNRDIAAGKTQRRESGQGLRQARRVNRQQNV